MSKARAVGKCTIKGTYLEELEDIVRHKPRWEAWTRTWVYKLGLFIYILSIAQTSGFYPKAILFLRGHWAMSGDKYLGMGYHWNLVRSQGAANILWWRNSTLTSKRIFQPKMSVIKDWENLDYINGHQSGMFEPDRRWKIEH